MENSTPHGVNIEQQRRVTATAIDSVDAFSDRQIILSFSGGRIVISGSGMKITGFSQSSGNFSAQGEITGVRYIRKGVSLAKKLFK